ncbi:hypothetical protein [uncultured Thomasclavelia sp.]|uniref:hypothetical protein n=1 Tax=uncultured Thomasclavelia sp. TaxID=3025759 RepID=UPI0025DD5EDE|nr:hypothetical protein [uncultured Thomasclavelia sp.]
MEAKIKNAYLEEIKYQSRMLNNLKRWMRNLIILSSISLVLVLFGSSIHPLIQIIGVVLMIISILACVLVGLGYKNGQNNVCKIIDNIK